MTELHLALTLIGGLVLGLGLFSRYIKDRLALSLPLVALGAGVAIGPVGFGLLDPATWKEAYVLVEEAARLTLAIGLMGVALRLPPRYFAEHWRTLVVLLGLVMPLMWAVGSGLAWLIVGLPLGMAALLGAVVTPTDPVVASSIVTSEEATRCVPGRVRHTLSAESGSNDGLAYLFVLLSLLLFERPAGDALLHWAGRVLLWEVLGAAVLGAAVGYGAGRLLSWGDRRGLVEETSLLAFTAALAVMTLGAARLMGTDGILAVFTAGVGFDRASDTKHRTAEENVQEAFNQFFSLPIFALLGVMLPVQAWGTLGWQAWAFVGALLLFRRAPAVLLLRRWMRPLQCRADALFAGWFGPIGVSALFYAMLVVRRLSDAGHPDHDLVWTIGSLVICASVVVHGITATPCTRWYGRVVGNGDADAEDEVQELEIEDELVD